jgi:hypothetical protein
MIVLFVAHCCGKKNLQLVDRVERPHCTYQTTRSCSLLHAHRIAVTCMDCNFFHHIVSSTKIVWFPQSANNCQWTGNLKKGYCRLKLKSKSTRHIYWLLIGPPGQLPTGIGILYSFHVGGGTCSGRSQTRMPLAPYFTPNNHQLELAFRNHSSHPLLGISDGCVDPDAGRHLLTRWSRCEILCTATRRWSSTILIRPRIMGISRRDSTDGQRIHIRIVVVVGGGGRRRSRWWWWTATPY